MRELTYNGITLGSAEFPLEVLGYENRPVYDGDGRTYLFNKITLSVRGVFNPKSVAYRIPGFGPPVATVGAWAAPTEDAVKHALGQPRKQLLYRMHDENNNYVDLIRSPAFRDPGNPGAGSHTVDANNGPLPTVHRVYPNHGLKTFVVDWSVETHLNDCDRATMASLGSVLLSHRWRMKHTIDQDFYTVRVVSGRAIFRTDRLSALGRRPDDYRAFLLHPIPPGFGRVHSEWEQGDGNNSIEYTLVDREKALSIIPANVTRIEAYETASTQLQSVVDATVRNSLDAFNMIGDIAVTAAAVASGGGAAAMGAGAGFGGVQNVFRMGHGFIERSMPTTARDIVVRVWGRQNVARSALQSVALLVIDRRLGLGGLALPSVRFNAVHDVMGRFVEVRLTKIMGPTPSILAGFGPLLPFNESDDMAGVAQQAPGTNPFPPNDLMSRGTYIGAIVSPSLQGSCAVHVGPTVSPNSPMIPVTPTL